MDELKNLMIQTLEANGILGQLRAEIRCSVFKIIDNQDDMENPKHRGKSALHWENPKARECLAPQHALLLAELIREYLDFYKLDYSKQVFMPETNLSTKQETAQEDLINQSGLSEDDYDAKKPLLLQILDKFKSGKSGYSPPSKGMKSSLAAGSPDGINFSDIKNKDQFQPLSVGEGILSQPDRTPPKQEVTKTDLHLEKANSLLDELSREQKSGFKAELDGIQMDNVSGVSPSRSGSGSPDQSLAKARNSTPEDNDEIDEDIQEDIPDGEMDMSDDRMQSVAKIGESHGITVSQSLGIDRSVDSLALEDYDHIEPVEKINN